MLSVKSYRQKAGLCGVASLKMVLDYFGCQKSEAELIKLAGATTGQGTSARGIKKAARKLGFSVRVKDNADFQDIKYWLAKKVPLIVDWFSTFGEAEGHYSVAVGLDKDFIYLQDPEIARVRKMNRKDFLLVWFDFAGDFIKNKNDLILRRMIIIERN